MSVRFLISLQFRPLVGDVTSPDYNIVNNELHLCTGSDSLELNGLTFYPGYIPKGGLSSIERGGGFRQWPCYHKTNHSSVKIAKFGLYQALKNAFALNSGFAKIYVESGGTVTQIFGGGIKRIWPEQMSVKIELGAPMSTDGLMPAPSAIGIVKFAKGVVEREESDRVNFEWDKRTLELSMNYLTVYLGAETGFDYKIRIKISDDVSDGELIGKFVLARSGAGAGWSARIVGVENRNLGAIDLVLPEFVDLSKFKARGVGAEDLTVFEIKAVDTIIRYAHSPIKQVVSDQLILSDVEGGVRVADALVDADGDFESIVTKPVDDVKIEQIIAPNSPYVVIDQFGVSGDSIPTEDVFNEEWVDPDSVSLDPTNLDDGVLLFSLDTTNVQSTDVYDFRIELQFSIYADRGLKLRPIIDFLIKGLLPNASYDDYMHFNFESFTWTAGVLLSGVLLNDVQNSILASGDKYHLDPNHNPSEWAALMLSRPGFKKMAGSDLVLDYYNTRYKSGVSLDVGPCEWRDQRFNIEVIIPLQKPGANTSNTAGIKLSTLAYELYEDLNVKDLRPKVYGEIWGDLALNYSANYVDSESVSINVMLMVDQIARKYLGLSSDWISPDMTLRGFYLGLKGGFILDAERPAEDVISDIAKGSSVNVFWDRKGQLNAVPAYDYDLTTTRVFNEGTTEDSVKVEQIRENNIYNEINLVVRDYNEPDTEVKIQVTGVDSAYAAGDISGIPDDQIANWTPLFDILRNSYEATGKKQTWSQTHFFVDPAVYGTEEEYYEAIREWLTWLFTHISKPHRIAAFDVSINVGAAQELFTHCCLQSAKLLEDETLFGFIHYIRHEPAKMKTHIEMFSTADESNDITAFDEEGLSSMGIFEESTGINVDEEVV